jgi:hypothetical protein
VAPAPAQPAQVDPADIILRDQQATEARRAAEALRLASDPRSAEQQSTDLMKNLAEDQRKRLEQQKAAAAALGNVVEMSDSDDDTPAQPAPPPPAQASQPTLDSNPFSAAETPSITQINSTIQKRKKADIKTEPTEPKKPKPMAPPKRQKIHQTANRSPSMVSQNNFATGGAVPATADDERSKRRQLDSGTSTQNNNKKRAALPMGGATKQDQVKEHGMANRGVLHAHGGRANATELEQHLSYTRNALRKALDRPAGASARKSPKISVADDTASLRRGYGDDDYEFVEAPPPPPPPPPPPQPTGVAENVDGDSYELALADPADPDSDSE